MSAAAARAHIDRFNAAVTSGDWSPLLATLHPDAVLTFEWSRGGTGTLTIRRDGGQITGLAIRFD